MPERQALLEAEDAADPAVAGHRPAARRAARDEGDPVAAGHRGGPHPLVAQLSRLAQAWRRSSAGGTPATVALTAGRRRLHAARLRARPARATSYGAGGGGGARPRPERVFKTLMAAVDGGLVVAVVPVSGQLDLKALARALRRQQAAMADLADAERATGYVVGGISPIGQKRPHPTVVDESRARPPDRLRLGRPARARPRDRPGRPGRGSPRRSPARSAG